MTSIYKLSDAPADYRQLWLDWLSVDFDDVDIRSIELQCNEMAVSMFRPNLLKALETWSEYDLSRVVGLADKNVLKLVPPLVHTNGFLTDGYHRVAACLLVGVSKMPCVNFATVTRELRKREKVNSGNDSSVCP